MTADSDRDPGVRIDPQKVIDRLTAQIGLMAGEVANWQAAYEASRAEVATLRDQLSATGDAAEGVPDGEG